MRVVFADTFYWIAIANPNDAWHEKAKSLSKALSPFRIVTSDEVLVEFLNFLTGRGSALRAKALQLVRSILTNANIQVCPQTRDSFLAGLAHYENRPDKDYSLTDCISMSIMRRDNISQVLTHDEHFLQDSLEPLLRD